MSFLRRVCYALGRHKAGPLVHHRGQRRLP